MSSISKLLEPSEEIDAANLFHLLGNRRRKYTVVYMDRVEEAPVEMGEAAEHVCALRKEKPLGSVTRRERKRAYSALRQTHLPKLDDHEIVEFSEVENTIDYGPKFNVAAQYASIEKAKSGIFQIYSLDKLSDFIRRN